MWTFYDYIDDLGLNVIQDWLAGLGSEEKPVRAKLHEMVTNIQQLPQLKRPATGRLEGDCEGVLEIRFSIKNTAYRPLFCYGNGRDLVLLLGATKRGKKGKKQDEWVPRNACRVALDRKQRIGEAGRIRPHDFS